MPASDQSGQSAGPGTVGTVGPPTAHWVMPAPRNRPKLFPPIHLLDDVRNLPRLLIRGYSIPIPSLVMILTFVLFEATGGNIDSTGAPALAFNLFIFPPSLFLPILAGILTQRSSYLSGGIVGLIAGVLFSIYVMTATFGPSSTGALITTDIRVQNVVYALVASTAFGLLLGGIGGFLQRLGRVVFAGS